jgi:hypothetical protein
MSTTDNGWPASPSLALRPLVIDGVGFVPGIVDNDDVATVLGYVLQQVADRVEKPVAGWCWGFAYRENVNSPNSLSRHSGGIAVDFNAPRHPNGAALTFSLAQRTTIRAILAEVENAVRWGGDFNGTPDDMHFEIDATPAELPAVAARIRNRLEDDMPAPKDWDAEDWAAIKRNVPSAGEVAAAVWAFVVRKATKTVTEQDAQAALKKAANR